MPSTRKLALLASWPPPHGGVTEHVRRLCPLLESRNIPYVVYNAGSESSDGSRVISVYKRRRLWLLRYILAAEESTIYIFSDRLIVWCLGALLAVVRGKRVLVRLRNSALPDWIASSWWRRHLAGMALRRMSAVVAVSPLLVRAAEKVGVEASRIHWAPGFLPPGHESSRREDVADEVMEFVETHGPVIASNGKVNWYKGQDLYGLDHMVELAARLKPDYPDVGIVVCFSGHFPSEQAYLEDLLRLAEDKGVADNILFNTREGVFVPVLSASDLFVRPTNTDGDANSLREALYLGVPAIASDVVSRPDETILFRCRDIDEFEDKVRSVLSALRSSRPDPGLSPQDKDRIDAYLDLLSR